MSPAFFFLLCLFATLVLLSVSNDGDDDIPLLIPPHGGNLGVVTAQAKQIKIINKKYSTINTNYTPVVLRNPVQGGKEG